MASKSTEQIAGTVVGAVVGFFVGGGPGGAVKGAYIGYSVGTAFTEFDLPPGPRLENREFDDSDYGSTIPLLFGRDIVPVSIAWMKENKYQEESRRTEVAKNQYQTQYTYKATVLLDLGEADFETIDRVWCNNVLYYTRFGVNLTDSKNAAGDPRRIGFYDGNILQKPAQALLAAEGANAIPFRGRTCLLIENLNLSESFFNSLPDFRILATRRNFTYGDETGNIVLGAAKIVQNGRNDAEVFLEIPDSYKYDSDYLGSATTNFLPKTGSYNSNYGLYGVHHIEGTRIYASSCHSSRIASAIEPDSSVKQINYIYSNRITSVFPLLHTRIAYRISRQEYDLTDAQDFSTDWSSMPAKIEREAWLFPFDLPVQSDVPYYDAGASVSARPFNIFIKPIKNTPDMYFIMYGAGTGGAGLLNVRFAIGKVFGDRFSVVALYGFNPADYQLSTDAATFDVQALDKQATLNLDGNDIRCEKIFNRIYIWVGPTTPNVTRNIGWVGTISISADLNFPNPIDFKKKDQIFDWSSFLYFGVKNQYIVDGLNQNFTSAYKVLDRTFNRLIPDFENERLYAYANGGYHDAVSGLTTEFPGMTGVTLDNVYEINPDNFDTISSYGSLSQEGTAYDGNGYVSEGQYFIFPGRVVQIDRDTTTIVGTSSSISNVANDINYASTNALELHAYPLSKTGIFTDALIGAGGVGTIFFDTSINPINPGVEQHRYYHGPNTTALISGTTTTLDQVVSALCLKTGVLTASDIDVTDLSSITVDGMVTAEQSSAMNSIIALAKVYLFDIVEEDYKLKFILRSGASLTRTIQATDLQAHEVGQKPFEIQASTPANYKSPSVYTASFRDKDSDYQPAVAQIESPFGENGERVDIQFPVALSMDEAYTALERISRATKSAEIGDIRFQTTFKHSDLEVGQFITVDVADGASFTGRILEKSFGRPGICKFKLRPDPLTNYGNASITYTNLNTTTTDPELASTMPVVIDSLGFTASEDGPGFWIGAYTAGNASTTAVGFQVSFDRGRTFTELGNRRADVLAARCVDALGAGEPGFIDSSVTLDLHVLDGTPVTVTNDQLLSDEETNTFFYGAPGRWEIIKILTFTDNGDGTYTATGFLRGYKGTEHFSEQHEPGDMLIAFDRTKMFRYVPPVDRFLDDILIRSIGYGTSGLRDVVDFRTKVSGIGALPLPVVDVKAYKADNNDWEIEWNRQSRYGIEWKNRFDVIQDEEIEQYVVYVLDTGDNNRIIRTITVDDQRSATYTDVMQVADWGVTQNSIELAIAKVSADYGVGEVTRVSF